MAKGGGGRKEGSKHAAGNRGKYYESGRLCLIIKKWSVTVATIFLGSAAQVLFSWKDETCGFN